ncbi:MAG TPA: PKD-like domain-containing protein [Mucilaginibacter sp.]|nr:PKD-like domain-containing protein [Mucilaginibacter sp.]
MPSGGTQPYSYAWNTGETTTSISVNKAGTYTVTVSDKTPGCAPVKKSITITSNPVPDPPTAASVTVCPNSSATLTATAPGGVYQWYDAPTGGNFLATGPTFNTPPVTGPLNYYVQTTLGGCTSQRTLVRVRLIPNPVGTGQTICSNNIATLRAAGGDTYSWYASPSGGAVLGTGPSFTTPVLTATTTYYVQAITNGCPSAFVPVTATVTPPPQAPSSSNVTICSGSVANLHASAPSGIFNWYVSPTGGSPLISSPDYTTPALTTTTTYYVDVTVGTCVSPRTAVTVTVTPLPSAPVAADVNACSGNTATLSVTPVAGDTYLWYNAPVGGILLATGNTFTTPVLTASTTYYVQATNGGCTSSARTAVNVTVNPVPAAPSAAGQVICSGTSATLTATAPGGVYQWYNAASGGTLLATGASYTTPSLAATTTYYLQTTVGGCVSPRTAVTVTVNTAPAAPAGAGVSICAGSSATISATGASGTSYQWYDASAGGNFLASGQAFVTPVLAATTTYYVQVTDANGCMSARTPITVTVTPTPAPPTASGVTICAGTSATLTATATGGTISWFDASTGGNLLGTGSSFTTPVLNSTTTYYAEHETGTCTSTRTAVTVTVTAVYNPGFQYASGTYCTSSSNPIPVINDPAGGTFSASPAGLVFVSTATGQINIGASAPGTYTVSFTSNAACAFVTTTKISIVTTPNATFSYTTPVCQSGTNPLPAFPVGASAGVFSSPTVVFVDKTTGEIDLKKTSPGTHSVTNTIPASGTCPAATFTFSIVIDPEVIVNAGSDQSASSGTPVTLAGSISGGSTTGTWSGGTGTFSNPNALNATYTPGPGETSATLTLTSSDPPGPCGAVSDKMTITFKSVPAAPTAQGVSICSGSTAVLSATAPGGVYQWYDATAGGTLLNTGAVFTTPPLTVNATYYVQTTVSGQTSTRTAVLVTVNSIPPNPVVAADSVCQGSTATLTASGSTGTYQWYDAAVGGNLLSTNNPYVTTFLTANTTLYVQAVNNGCTSGRTAVTVTVNPVPTITSKSTGVVCSGTPNNYTITADIPNATYNWSRAAVANISNPAVTNQSSSTITETLINTSGTPVNVTYVIIPIVNGCQGTPFNYVLTVNPLPAVTSAATDTACNQSPINYTIAFNTAGASFTWSRAAVPGISNAAVSGQTAATIKEVLYNATNEPVNVTYVYNYSASGCSGTFSLVVTVNPYSKITSPATGVACGGIPQNYVITSNVSSTTFVWSRAAVNGISNPGVSGQTSSTITETLINTTVTSVLVKYIITPFAFGCAGTPFSYAVTVNPQPSTPTANSNSPVCVGSTIRLQTLNVPGATYVWTGPNGFSSSAQNPNIGNVTTANTGTYYLYVLVNGCPSQIDSVRVVVDEPPLSNAGPDQTVCINSTSVTLAGSVTGGTTTGTWSTSGTGSFSPSNNTLNAQYLPSAQDKSNGSAKLTLGSTSKDDCAISTSTMTVTFYQPMITSSKSDSVCTGSALNYTITTNSPTATATWSRAAVAGISNPAVAAQTSMNITETLVNTTSSAIMVPYTITPLDNGCPGAPFTYTVKVNPQPVAPAVSSNSPVCVGTSIQLNTTTTANGYLWTGPNGFTSTQQNPTINNVSAANTGAYNLIVTVNGCQSPAASLNVSVDEPPVANAGPNQVVCSTTASVALAGSVTGGTTTGIWSTGGSGTFSPSDTVLNGHYLPSAQDVAAGSVTLTLASTSKDNCNISTSVMTISFQAQAAVKAGKDTAVCSQTTGVQLNGKVLIAAQGVWTTSGTGTFNPSANQLNAVYVPSSADIAAGSVKLTLSIPPAGVCFLVSDSLVVTFVPPPTVNAGGTVYVLHGRTITLTPTVSDNNVTYSWSPDINISSTTVKNPVITGDVDRTYTLTVTDSRGCVSSDQTFVKVSPEVVVPNTFTPNGDGVNDLWNIQGLIAYREAVVDIFDRYGQKVYHSIGYAKPWDGIYNGKMVPYGVYYYVIDTKLDGIVLSGYVTVVR